ncbi:putative ATP-grasp-modified RiPP [Streptomyces sp. NPDC086554]|uniref:putative ATP-grasp-modified RiPP n=1 Tax=Streptomyces sp. NPDC086554 TaxID=3154864 RepID=UPI00344AFE71
MNLIEALPLGRSAPVAPCPIGLRPYALVGARFTTAELNVPHVETRVYDPVTQTASLEDGTPLTAMATSQKTNPDGDKDNPPPHDEGPDPGFIE